MKKIDVNISIVAIMIVLAAFARIIPHPYNFTPLMAMALFGGATFNKKSHAYIVPVAAYLLSDVVFVLLGKPGFYGISQLFVYAAMLLVTALGTTMGRPKFLNVFGYSLSGSAIFWLVSNFGVWFANYMASGTTAHEQGLTLGLTYLRALPFYNTYSNELFFGAFAGDIFYSLVLFGVYALVQKRVTADSYSRA